MYINFWYPIGKSDDITADEPFRIQVLGLQFVAFRDGGDRARVLSDTCAHRGGSLGKGWIKDGCLVCPYHGWRFEGGGKCVTIPSIGYDGKPPARAKIDSYPVEEKYGIVFAFLGDLPEAQRPPLYEIEEYQQEDWRANDLIVLEVDYYYERSMENGFDPAHNEFVHPTHGFSGTKPDYRVRDFDVEELSHGCWGTFVMDSSSYKDATMQKIRASEGISVITSGAFGPNVLITHIHLTDQNWFHQYFFEAPIDENRTRIFFVNMRNCLLAPEFDERIRDRNLVIAKQDIECLTEVDPIRTPSNNAKEVLMPADRIIVRYREWLKKWDNKGWRIDVATLRAKQGDVAYSIPCPDRKTSGNWVLDPVPLLPASDEQKIAAE